MDNYALTETAKTIARGLWFSFLGLVALVLTAVATSPDVAEATVVLPVVETPVSVGTFIVAVVASLIKVIDRYRHKAGNGGIAPKFLQR